MNDRTTRPEAREELRGLLSGTIRTGTITLASGRTTDFYLDDFALYTSDPGIAACGG